MTKKEKLWQGRYHKSSDKLLEEFSESISFDRKLYPYDIEGSKAHARMLCDCSLISKAERDSLLHGLDAIRQEMDAGKFTFDPAVEDIHMHIEARLIALIGPVGEKIHTARSRNDQVALDLRLYLIDQIALLRQKVRALQISLVEFSKKNVMVIIPGYTHLQHAQPVLLAHHVLAYVEMLGRDDQRLAEASARANVSPLGSGALAGTSLPIDREKVAKALGFAEVCANSIDAVSDRDFAVEFLSAAALCGVHLSRLGEDLVLWSSHEFNFIDIDEAFCTGSSMMPQKKNPDVVELVRGKAGRFIGNLVRLLTVLKGLPLSYNRDMQEDKEPVFDSVEQLGKVINILARLMENVRVRPLAEQRLFGTDFSCATDIAEYLVRKGVPFRKAHQITGSLVSYCIENHTGVEQMELEALKKFAQEFEADIKLAITVPSLVESKKSYGGTSPVNVRKQLREWEKRLKGLKKNA